MTDLTISDAPAWNTVQEEDQYSLVKILGIWVAGALPMAILGWVAYPALSPDFESDPIGAAYTRFGLIIAGLIWTFVLSLIIVYREEGDLHWETIRRRLWLNTPRDPQTGEPRRVLWLWLIPFILLFLGQYGHHFTASDSLVGLGVPDSGQHGHYRPWITGNPGPIGGRLEISGADLRYVCVQYPGRRIPLPGRAAAKDGRHNSAGGTGWPMVCCLKSITCTSPG